MSGLVQDGSIMNDDRDLQGGAPGEQAGGKASGIKLLVLVFGIPLLLVMLAQFLVF